MSSCRATNAKEKPRVLSDCEQLACLAAARRFGDWLVQEEVWASNPIAEVVPVGRAKAGEDSKPQLRRDEALVWLAEARRQAAAADEMAPAALAAAVCFIGALRVSEDGLADDRRVADFAQALRRTEGAALYQRRDDANPLGEREHVRHAGLQSATAPLAVAIRHPADTEGSLSRGSDSDRRGKDLP